MFKATQQLCAFRTSFELKATADPFFGNKVLGRDGVPLELRVRLDLAQLCVKAIAFVRLLNGADTNISKGAQ